MPSSPLPPTITPEHTIAGLTWLIGMSSPQKWNLLPSDLSILLGGCPAETLQQQISTATSDSSTLLDPDAIERLGLLLGIHKNLCLLAPTDREDVAYQWFNQPNTGELLKGKSIREHLLANTDLPAFYEIQTYLESMIR